jgi:hypothetical protein
VVKILSWILQYSNIERLPLALQILSDPLVSLQIADGIAATGTDDYCRLAVSGKSVVVHLEFESRDLLDIGDPIGNGEMDRHIIL